MSAQVEVRKMGFAHWRWAVYAPPYAYRSFVDMRSIWSTISFIYGTEGLEIVVIA